MTDSATAPPQAGRRWANLRDAAAYLDSNVGHMRRLVAAGKLPAYRLGGQWRVDLAEIDEFITTELRQAVAS